MDLGCPLKVLLIWITVVFHGSNTKTKLEREKRRTGDLLK